MFDWDLTVGLSNQIVESEFQVGFRTMTLKSDCRVGLYSRILEWTFGLGS